jgi:hypothetical protein
LLHNHPSGDPTPSRADVEMTQAIVAVARPLGIAVHDHVIVGKDGHASLKEMKLIQSGELERAPWRAYGRRSTSVRSLYGARWHHSHHFGAWSRAI